MSWKPPSLIELTPIIFYNTLRLGGLQLINTILNLNKLKLNYSIKYLLSQRLSNRYSYIPVVIKIDDNSNLEIASLYIN